MNPWQRLALAGLLAWGTGGCAVLLVGAGAAGGYAVSRDSVRNHFDLPWGAVYQESLEVVTDLGLVTLQDDQRGIIQAIVEGANVTVTVKRLSERTCELRVKARTNLLLPKIDVAHTVYNRIFERLQ